MTQDIFISGVDELYRRLFRIWCTRNKIPYNVAMEMFIDLTIKRKNWALGFGRMDAELDELLREKLETDPRLKGRLDISPVQRYFGYLLKPLTADDVRAVQEELKREEAEEVERKEVEEKNETT